MKEEGRKLRYEKILVRVGGRKYRREGRISKYRLIWRNRAVTGVRKRLEADGGLGRELRLRDRDGGKN